MAEKRVELVVEVVIEVPRGSRNKYEYDQERQLFRFDRRLTSATTYPADYGFVPDTLGEDGEPLDALVLVEDPTFPGCRISTRPVAIFWMTDEAGPDAKVICLPSTDPNWQGVRNLHQLPRGLRAEIERFFQIYNALDPGTSSSTGGYGDRSAAIAEIRASRARFQSAGPTRGQWVAYS